MSVHQETVITRSSEATEDAPQLEYGVARQDSLTMFGAAIGGAVLGMLLTLLILAIINGGTLSFNEGERINEFTNAFTALSANVDANTQNTQILGEQVASDMNALAEAVNNQRGNIEDINATLETLDVTRRQFNTFMDALSEAVRNMEAIDAGTGAAAPAPSTAPATESPGASAPSSTETVQPAVAESADVPVNAVLVLPFVDANGDGVVDAGESVLTDVTASLVSADGTAVATLASTADGITFTDVAPGDYELVIEDPGAHAALRNLQVPVTVPAESQAGQAVYLPLTE